MSALRDLADCLALIIAAGAATWAANPANAHSYKLGDIAIGHIWAPSLEEGADGIPVYGPLLNRRQGTARVVGATTPVADDVRFRRNDDGDVSWVATLELPPGKPLAMAAWREHIWLSELQRPLAPGESFPLTLDFGAAGTQRIEVVVESAAGH